MTDQPINQSDTTAKTIANAQGIFAWEAAEILSLLDKFGVEWRAHPVKEVYGSVCL